MGQLLSAKHDVNKTEKEGGTASMRTAGSGHMDIAQTPIAPSANVHRRNSKGSNALHMASFKGYKEMVEFLLDSGSNVDEQNEAGRTPLMLAAKMGQSSVVSTLLLAGANVGLECVEGQTALHYAAEGNHIDCGPLLVEAGEDVTAADAKSRTPLDIASVNEMEKQGGTAGSGHMDIAQTLIAASANVHLRNSKGQTALHLASSKGHKEMVELLVDSDSNVDEQDEAGRTPLMLAAKMGQSSVVSTLLLAGANVGLECVEGQTALHYAAEGNHIDCGPLLVEAGEDVTAADAKSRTPLDIASVNEMEKQGVTAGSGHMDIAQTLIAANANVHLRNSKGQTALHLASSKGHKEMVELLVDSDSNVDEQDEAGRTPLMLAAKMGQSGVVSTLLLAGAKVGLECVEGQTALHYAAEGNHIDCGPLLVEAGEDVTAADAKSQTPLDTASVNESKKQGGTALMWTAGSGHLNIAQTLIAANANVHLRNSKGQTALHLASSKGHKEMVELLVDSDSNVDEQDEAGRTPLMLAAKMGKSSVVSTLLLAGAKVGLECVEGQTALHYAAEGNHIDCGPLLVEAGEDVTAADVKSRTPLDIASVEFYEAVQQRIIQSLKPVVVLAGSADNDASTLIRALQDENRKMAQQFVKLPQVATDLGCIEPDQLSEQMEAQFYNIAECSKLVSNNESFLNTLLSKPGVPVTLLLQVKVTEEEDTIKKKLLHWLQPRTAMSAPSLPQVIVVGDCLDHESEQEVYEKLQRCTQLIQEELQVQLKGHILVDCQNPQTECINKIGRLVRDFSQSRSATSHLPYNLSLVVSQLRSSVNARTLQLHEFAKWMEDTKTKLPRNLPSPEELCQDLSAAGYTYYLANKQNPSQGSLVLDLPALFHKVYCTLFSGSQGKVNQFGLLHCSQLTELFPEFDEALIQEVLFSLQLCMQIDRLLLKEELLQMTTDKEREGWLYFPALVSAQPPKTFPDKPDLEPQRFQWVCWQLRTAGKQRVPAHSLQTILHHATTYSRVSPKMKEHSCTVWVNGFSWSSTKGVDVAIHISDRNVVQIIGCSNTEFEELYSYTSTIVHDIIQTIPELSPRLGTASYIVHPYTLALWEDPNPPSSDTMYPILSIVQGIHRGDGYIPSLPGEAGDLPNLIRLDELFGGCSPPLSTLEDIAGYCEYMHNYGLSVWYSIGWLIVILRAYAALSLCVIYIMKRFILYICMQHYSTYNVVILKNCAVQFIMACQVNQTIIVLERPSPFLGSIVCILYKYFIFTTLDGPPSPDVAAAQSALKDLCMIPDGIQSLSTDSTGGQYQLEPPGGQEDEPTISIKVPPGSIKTRDGSATVDYAVIPDGPFRPPDGYQFGSVVVYISYDSRSFTKALSLSLPHWYGGQDRAQDGLVFAMAPHAMEEGEQFYHFKTLQDGGEFGVLHGNLNLNDPHVLLAVMFREGATQSYYASLWTCQYSPTLFCNKVAITFSHHYWLQVCSV